MEQPSVKAVHKLVEAGKQAGFSVDQMIALLEAGLTVETLLELIEWRLNPPEIASGSSRWIV